VKIATQKKVKSFSKNYGQKSDQRNLTRGKSKCTDLFFFEFYLHTLLMVWNLTGKEVGDNLNVSFYR
jgi:hypothetical protein